MENVYDHWSDPGRTGTDPAFPEFVLSGAAEYIPVDPDGSCQRHLLPDPWSDLPYHRTKVSRKTKSPLLNLERAMQKYQLINQNVIPG